MKKTGIIIQARISSTRLPAKVMLDLCGKPVLWHVMQRLKQVKNVQHIIIATTDQSCDDIIVDFAQRTGAEFFRGSQDDVLARYYNCARHYGLTDVVRITSDCPLIDSIVLERLVEEYAAREIKLAANVHPNQSLRTYPRGLDAEVFSFDMLAEAFALAKQGYQREHVTPYIYEVLDEILVVKNDIDYSSHRWTLDTVQDYEFIWNVYKRLYKGAHDFYMDDILAMLEAEPSLLTINAEVQQKTVAGQ